MTSMTRQHFQLIADSLYDCRPKPYDWEGDWAFYVHLVNTFAVNLASTNERFDKRRFLAACGVGEYD